MGVLSFSIKMLAALKYGILLGKPLRGKEAPMLVVTLLPPSNFHPVPRLPFMNNATLKGSQ
jgi:hypothetical protein